MIPAIQAGREIREFIDQKRLDLGLSGQEMLGLLLTTCYGFAASEVFPDLQQKPERLLVLTHKVWQGLWRTQRIQVVEELRFDASTGKLG